MDELYADCPACEKKQLHKIIRFKEHGLAIAKCVKCGSLHHIEAREKPSPKGKVEVLLVIPKGGEASKEFMKFSPKEKLKKGAVIEFKRKRYEVRAIECHDNERRDSCVALDVRAVWVAPYTKKISVSVHIEGKTVSYPIEYAKDKLLKLGEKVRSDKKSIEVTKILTKKGESKSAKVEDILSLYGKLV